MRWVRCSLFGVLVCAVGCGQAPKVALPTVWIAPPPYAPRPGSSNAFDAYALAAIDGERRDPTGLARVSFTPGQKSASLARLSEPLQRVFRATRLECRFEFRPVRLGEARLYHSGWRLLGRCMAWKVDDFGASGRFDEASAWAVAGIRFGLALTGGGAMDASLGFAVVDDCRMAIGRWLPSMGAAQLNAFARQIEAAWRARPSFDVVIENERAQMVATVQSLQDLYAGSHEEALGRWLGVDADGVKGAWRTLRGRPPAEQAQFFVSLVEEGRLEADTAGVRAAQPPFRRSAWPVDADSKRPWRPLSMAFFRSLRTLLEQSDRAVTRIQLLSVSAFLLGSTKANRVAPVDLRGLRADLCQDVYSGRPFEVRSIGGEAFVYSVGANLRDDGGETDSDGQEPDLIAYPLVP